jgi:hypothetical protein
MQPHTRIQRKRLVRLGLILALLAICWPASAVSNKARTLT